MLEIIIALAAAIFLGNTLAHRIRVTPAILLIFLGLALALLPAMHELREVGLPSYVIAAFFGRRIVHGERHVGAGECPHPVFHHFEWF